MIIPIMTILIVVLDILVISTILKREESTSAKFTFSAIVLLIPVLGIFVYYSSKHTNRHKRV